MLATNDGPAGRASNRDGPCGAEVWGGGKPAARGFPLGAAPDPGVNAVAGVRVLRSGPPLSANRAGRIAPSKNARPSATSRDRMLREQL